MTAIGLIAGMTIGNLIYHGLIHKDWERAIAVSVISAVLVGACYACTGYPQ